MPEEAAAPAPQSAPPSAPNAAPKRSLGRFELRALLSKTQRTMLWLVWDTRAGQELYLAIPRKAPAGADAMAYWLQNAQTAARVRHPKLAPVVEVGNVEQWPYVAYERALGETLTERLNRQAAVPLMEATGWISQALDALAFAHEAGHAHRDLQCHSLVVDGNDRVHLIGLEVAQIEYQSDSDFGALARSAVRDACEEDVLGIGLVLHRILAGKHVLDLPDFQDVIQRMQPIGHEIVRLGWETPQPIPDPLRAICNRATDRQARQRYHIARSFLRALEGWREISAQGEAGPIALLMDKLQRVGHLPSTSSALLNVGHSSAMAAQHTSAVADLVLKDMALFLELLRRVNNTLRQHGAAADSAVLNVRRAIALMGLGGVEDAARSLKPWPGPLPEVAAGMLRRLMIRVQREGQVAQALAPAGYDSDVVYLVTVMQNLGRLLVLYHFPEDGQQIRQLMQPPEPTEVNPNPLGMTEQAAAYAVMGCDLDSLGLAVARYWGMGDEMLQMMRRQAPDVPVRASGSDADLLRLSCSMANELLDALGLHPEPRHAAIVETITRRYSRVLGIGLREVHLALNPEKSPTNNGEDERPPVVGAPKASPLRSKLGFTERNNNEGR